MRLRERFARFMAGRNGNDNLNSFILAVTFILIIVNLFVRKYTFVLSLVIWGLIILAYLRMFSRNTQKRYRENTRYLLLKQKVLDFFAGRTKGVRDAYRQQEPRSERASRPRSDAEHRIFRCPKCSQRVRVPRGRGKIEITCPRCGEIFVKRS